MKNILMKLILKCINIYINSYTKKYYIFNLFIYLLNVLSLKLKKNIVSLTVRYNYHIFIEHFLYYLQNYTIKNKMCLKL